MEYDWERTFPFLEIEKSKVIRLFEDILEEKYISNVIPINEGCRTTNYVIETNKPETKYILKVFFSKEQNYKKEIKLLTKLKESGIVLVPKIYKFSKHEFVQNKEYAIYDYIEGKTIGQAISEGYVIEDTLVRDIAKFLAQIHSCKFDKAGFLDKDLNIREELPPIIEWYDGFIGERAKERLGKGVIDKINLIVKENEKALTMLDKDIRLVHGDFQGTNILIKNNRLSGVLDWEFVMAGHPLADIGQFFRYEEYFNENLIQVFEDEYNKNSSYTLVDDWYKLSKFRDLINLIQLIDTKENMPNKHAHIKRIVIKTIYSFD